MAKLCLTPCDHMDYSTPVFSFLHYLPKFTQIHAHWVSDAIQPSHPLPPLSPFVFNLSQHQRLENPEPDVKRVIFASGGQSIWASSLASVLPVTIQGWFPLRMTRWSPCSPRDSQESSPTPQFESINSLALSLLYDPTLTSTHDYLKNHNSGGRNGKPL